MIRTDANSVQRVVTPHGTLFSRPETEADEAFLFRLFESVKGTMFTGVPIGDDMKARLLEMQFRAMTRSYRASFPDEAFQVVMLDDAPIGRLIADIGGDRVHVVYIALLPSWRHRGIGAALMRALLRRAQESGLGCEATIAIDNLPSLRLWAGLAFVERTRDAANIVVEWWPEARTNA